MLVKIGKHKLSKKGKIKRAYCAIFYKSISAVRILYGRIINDSMDILSYDMSYRKQQLDYVSEFYGKIAFTQCMGVHKGISCIECAGVFL